MPQYETAAEANTRLTGTIFLFKENVVYCNECSHNDKGDVVLNLTFFPSGQHSITHIGDPDLRYRGLQLGYLNTARGCSYVTRIPTRRYKQGFCSENVRFSMVGDEGAYPRWGDIYKSPEFQDVLLGRYPSIEQAAERLTASGDKKPVSVAFDRRFGLRWDAFRKDFLLEYRGRVVGFGDARSFRCAEDHEYLREVIQESKIKLR